MAAVIIRARWLVELELSTGILELSSVNEGVGLAKEGEEASGVGALEGVGDEEGEEYGESDLGNVDWEDDEAPDLGDGDGDNDGDGEGDGNVAWVAFGGTGAGLSWSFRWAALPVLALFLENNKSRRQTWRCAL